MAVHQRDPVVLPPVRLQLRARSALPPPCSGSARSAPPPSPAFTVRPATTADIGILAAIEAEAASGTAFGPAARERGVRLGVGPPTEEAWSPAEILVIEPTTAEGRTRSATWPISVGSSTGWCPCTPSSCGAASTGSAPTAAVARSPPRLGPRRPRWLRARGSLQPARRSPRSALRGDPARPRNRPRPTGCTSGSPMSSRVLRAVAPVLEARLAASPAIGWTGELHIDLYTGGLLIRFDEGRRRVDRALEPAGRRPRESRRRPPPRSPSFLHLLLGNRRIDELERTTADCLAGERRRRAAARRALPADAAVDVGVLLTEPVAIPGRRSGLITLRRIVPFSLEHPDGRHQSRRRARPPGPGPGPRAW